MDRQQQEQRPFDGRWENQHLHRSGEMVITRWGFCLLRLRERFGCRRRCEKPGAATSRSARARVYGRAADTAVVQQRNRPTKETDGRKDGRGKCASWRVQNELSSSTRRGQSQQPLSREGEAPPPPARSLLPNPILSAACTRDGASAACARRTTTRCDLIIHLLNIF